MSDSSELDRAADRRFAERLAEHYRPAPLGRAQQARFDAELRERIERRRRGRAWAPALAAAAVVVSLAWGLWPAAPVPSDPARHAPGVAMTTSDWEVDVLLTDPDETLVAEEAYLPDEYVALAAAFLDGP